MSGRDCKEELATGPAGQVSQSATYDIYHIQSIKNFLRWPK